MTEARAAWIAERIVSTEWIGICLCDGRFRCQRCRSQIERITALILEWSDPAKPWEDPREPPRS